jgi:hypothetical protein
MRLYTRHMASAQSSLSPWFIRSSTTWTNQASHAPVSAGTSPVWLSAIFRVPAIHDGWRSIDEGKLLVSTSCKVTASIFFRRTAASGENQVARQCRRVCHDAAAKYVPTPLFVLVFESTLLRMDRAEEAVSVFAHGDTTARGREGSVCGQGCAYVCVCMYVCMYVSGCLDAYRQCAAPKANMIAAALRMRGALPPPE